MTIASATGSADTGLAAALRHDTRAAHTRAEESVFIQRLITGTLPLSAYVALTAQNLAIYTALEELGEIWRDDPVAGPFLFEELRRVPRLRYDLEYMLGPDWPDLTRELVVPASHCYVAHLHDVGPRWPAGYVAHHYVRYLGDLAGGQVIRSAIQRSYATDEKLAVTFYIFESIEKVKPFRDRYRWLLDAMPIGDDEQAQVIAEANTAFELNRAVSKIWPSGTAPDARVTTTGIKTPRYLLKFRLILWPPPHGENLDLREPSTNAKQVRGGLLA